MDEEVKLGRGIKARIVPCNHSYLGQSFMGREYMCCFCGYSISDLTATCYNCGADLEYGKGPATEVEKRDMQIYRLKSNTIGNWNFQGVLLHMLAAFARGETPTWPERYGSSAQQWLTNNGWSRGVRGHEIASVTETWKDFGKGT